MLRISRREPVRSGFYVTGEYTLLIVNVVDGEPNFERVYSEYVFYPNPTDIDRQMNVPNDIQPDQLDGFYTNVNTVGSFILTIRGTTGQKKKSRMNQAFGVSGVNEIGNLIGANVQEDAYTEYMSLTNFFADWFTAIYDDPSGYAMIFLNAKDNQFFRVLPMSLGLPRTSGRPLHYNYTLSFQALREETPTGRYAGGRTNAMDIINQTRANMERWKKALMDVILSTSYLSQRSLDRTVGVVNAEYSRVGSMLQGMADGLQGMAYVSTSVDAGASDIRNSFRETRELVRDVIGSLNKDDDSVTSQTKIFPPTKYACRELFGNVPDIQDEIGSRMLENNPGGKSVSIDPASPYIDEYGVSLELEMNAALVTDLAPLPDYDPASDASSEIRSMHRIARSGTVGMLEGREDELSSASYATETYSLDGTRHPLGITDESVSSTSLSYLTAMILQTWGTLNDSALSPALSVFRSAFLGARDPSSIASVYKIITVGGADSIYSLAEKHLGTWERWAEISLINGLEYPYISRYGGLTCKVPGDIIYIPTRDARVSPDLLETLSDIVKVHDRMTLTDVFLGFDIRLDPSSGDSQYEKYDFAFVKGFDAFVQEVGFVLESNGGLTSDPERGIGVRIGTKSAGSRDISLWHCLIDSWFSNDDRVEKVEKVEIKQESGAIYFNVKVKFRGVDESQVIASRVRR